MKLARDANVKTYFIRIFIAQKSSRRATRDCWWNLPRNSKWRGKHDML
jgi:hypothetical protein